MIVTSCFFIALFLVADLVCATSGFSIFRGLQRSGDYGILKAPSETDSFSFL